ncbi:hypothetical protein TNCV_620821 [Trichonephila clavipes]|nr:hypothetical protein TNCV_620821 [Trichonephila clavipes]
MDNVSEHVDITELEVKPQEKIDQLQRKIEELKELLFGLETAKPTEEAEFEDLYKCEHTSGRFGGLKSRLQYHRIFVGGFFFKFSGRINIKILYGFYGQIVIHVLGKKLTLQKFADLAGVIFGVNSSPFHTSGNNQISHYEKYNEIHPITATQHLDSFMHVDGWITGQWAAEGFDTHPMDASIRLGTNKTKVLGMKLGKLLDDCLMTLDTKGRDNPSDFLSRGLSVTLISNNKYGGLVQPSTETDELPKTVSEFARNFE